MLRNSWTIDVHWVSPPGVPKGMNSLPSLKAMAGFGVSLGRFQGWRLDGWLGSSHDWEPRDDIWRPRPGTIGLPASGSLGVAENALPHRSTVQT